MASATISGECWNCAECYATRKKTGIDQCKECRVIFKLVAKNGLCARCHESDIIGNGNLPCTGFDCHATKKECDRQRKIQGLRKVEGNWVRDISLQAALEAMNADATENQPQEHRTQGLSMGSGRGSGPPSSGSLGETLHRVP